MNIRDVHQHLLRHDIKPSMQRVAIMQYLMEHRTHPTIDQIFSDLHPDMPTLSKTTVYNTLKLLHEKKAVLALTIDEKNVRYDGYTSRHAHFKCKKCGVILDISMKEKELSELENASGFTIEETQVYFLGTCEPCK